jgi:glycosyltransferase
VKGGKDKGGTPFDFAQDDTIDAVYSDLVYVRSKTKDEKREKHDSEFFEHSSFNTEHSVIRYWKAGDPASLDSARDDTLRMTKWLEKGWMPPHPTLFIRKNIFEKYGLYRTDMKIAADYEMVLRLFYKHKITPHYLPLTTYCMTIGGASNKSLKNIFIKSSEDYRAMKMHSLPFSVKTLLMKNFRKLPQFFLK